MFESHGKEWNRTMREVLAKKEGGVLCVGVPVVDVQLPHETADVPEYFRPMYADVLALFEHEDVQEGKKIELHDVVGLEEKWMQLFAKHPVTKSQFMQLLGYLKLGGGVCNIARALDNLEIHAYIVAKAGKDKWGFAVHSLLHEDKSVRGHIELVRGYPTTVALWKQRITALVHRRVKDQKKNSFQNAIDYTLIDVETPSAVMISSVLTKLPENLCGLKARWPEAPRLLLGTSTIKQWTLAQAMEIFALVPYVRMNAGELIGLLKSTGCLEKSFVEGVGDSEILAQAAGSLTKFLPKNGMLVATGGGGHTLMIAQDGSYRILPCPPPKENPKTHGAGDASTALAHYIGTLEGIDFCNPSANWDKAVRQECAVFCAMTEYVDTGEVNLRQVGKHRKDAGAIVERVVLSRKIGQKRGALPRGTVYTRQECM